MPPTVATLPARPAAAPKFTGLHANDHPAVSEARVRLSDLQRQLGRVEESIEAARRDWQAEQASRSNRAGRAADLAAGRAPAPFASLPLDLAAEREQVETLKAAVGLAEQRLQEAKFQANDEILARLRPTLADLFKRQHAALKALSAVLDEANALRIDMQDGGTAVNDRLLYLAPEQLRALVQSIEADAQARYGLNLS